MVVVDALFGTGQRRLDYDYTPTAVFTHPNIGSCGYTEAAARAKFGAVIAGKRDPPRSLQRIAAVVPSGRGGGAEQPIENPPDQQQRGRVRGRRRRQVHLQRPGRERQGLLDPDQTPRAS